MGQRGELRAGDYNFFLWKRIKNYQLGTVSAVKRLEVVSDRMLYMVLRVCWCNIIVLNVHAPREEKSDDSIVRFYEEFEQVFFFYHFPKYHMEILLGYFKAKGGKRIFSNRKLGMNVYLRIVMIMVFE